MVAAMIIDTTNITDILVYLKTDNKKRAKEKRKEKKVKIAKIAQHENSQRQQRTTVLLLSHLK